MRAHSAGCTSYRREGACSPRTPSQRNASIVASTVWASGAGGRQFSPAASRELARIRDLAVAQMWSMARGKGANAVIGMRFDNRMLGSDCVEICAYGTAVLVRRVRPRAGQDTPSVDWAQLDRRAAPLATPRGSG